MEKGSAENTPPSPPYKGGARGSENGFSDAPDRSVLIGKAVHYILERWDFKNDKLVVESIREDTKEEMIPEDVINRFVPHQSAIDMSSVKHEIKGIMKTFLFSPAYKELKAAEIIGREVPFAISWEGQVMEGFMDVIFKDGDNVYIADYKTDRVLESELENKAAEYFVSGRIYSEAVKRCMGIKAAGFKLIFLRTGKSILIKLQN